MLEIPIYVAIKKLLWEKSSDFPLNAWQDLGLGVRNVKVLGSQQVVEEAGTA